MVKWKILLLAVALPAYAGDETYSQAEVSRHQSKSDCWITIDGDVFDVTDYVARHRKFDYDIAKHCGSDASALWQKKPGTGEAHSRKAERLLSRYYVGKLRK